MTPRHETVLTRYHAAWSDVLAAQREIADAAPVGEARRREEALYGAFVAFREAQMDYYTWLGLTVIDVQRTVNEIRELIEKHHA